MIIESVTLNNYRQYRKKVTFKLGVGASKNINVIIGSNGAGKTNLSNAIQWCFYGKEPSLKEGVGFGILNMAEFTSMEEGSHADVSVEVVISHNNEKYTIIRTKTIEKNQNKPEALPFEGMGAQEDGSRLQAYFAGTAKSKPSLDTRFPTTLINILAPAKISEYFFFDGEKLDKYFADSQNLKIRESIFQISQLDLLANIEERLNSIIRDYRKDARGITPELDKIESDIANLERKLDDNKRVTLEKKGVLDKLRLEKVKLLNRYRELGGESAEKILERNEEIEKDIENTRMQLEEKENEKLDILITDGYLYYSINAFKYSLKLFDKAEKDGIIPPIIDPNFIKKLLDSGICICHSDISLKNKNKEARKYVVELYNKYSSGLGSLAIELMQKQIDMSHIIKSKLKLRFDTIKILNNSIQEFNGKIEHLNKELNDNKSKIVRGAEKEKMKNFKSNILDLENKIDELIGELAVLKVKKDELTSEYKDKKDNFEKQAKKEKKGQEINKVINFCDSAVKCASMIKTKILDEIRQEITKETAAHYKELHWKKDEIVDIVIDDNYKIYALQNKFDKFGTFAAGERAMLAMSFLIALNHVSGFNVPIIMDTALGRIGSLPRRQFSQNIAKYLKDNQIILLFTETEYSSEVREKLKSSINREYQIKLSSPLEANIIEK